MNEIDFSKIDELRMHKVLFLVYAKFYNKYKIELWTPDFRSWQYGPVEITYRNNINTNNFNSFNIFINLNDEQKHFLHNLISDSLQIDIWDIINWSHETLAYKNGLNNINKKINNEDIKK